ncbi:unnamed protein product [Lota lota]
MMTLPLSDCKKEHHKVAVGRNHGDNPSPLPLPPAECSQPKSYCDEQSLLPGRTRLTGLRRLTERKAPDSSRGNMDSERCERKCRVSGPVQLTAPPSSSDTPR